MIAINLLDNRRKEIIKRQTLLAKLNVAGFVFLGLSVVLLMSISGLRFFFSKNLEDLESKNKTLQAQIKTYSEVFESMDHIRTKLVSIDSILDSRNLALKKLELFFNLYQSNLLVIKNVGLGGAANPLEFEVSGQVGNIGEFVNLHEYIRKLTIEKSEFDQVVLRSLSRNTDGFYSFSYLITYSQEQKS